MRISLIRPLRIAAFSVIASMVSLAQHIAVSHPGTLDHEVVIPSASGVLGRQDAVALAEIQDHRRVVGISAWIGMQGTGTITYRATDSTQYNATLTNLGTDRFRLDAQTQHGEISVRINGRAGKIRGPGDQTRPIPPESAAWELFPFELLRAKAFPQPDVSVLDRGMVPVAGNQLHRVTVEVASPSSNESKTARLADAIDFYFDPQSHLLVKSACFIFLPDSRHVTFLSIVTYSDYRKVGSVTVPFRYSETLEGEQYRVLQLSDLQLDPTLSSPYFVF